MLLQDEAILILTYIYEIGTIAGIGILVFCLYLTERIVRMFPGGNIVKKWRIMQLILVSFIILYIVDWAVWIYNIQNLIYIIGGILRILTAVLFGLVLLLFYKTTQIILKKSSK